MAAYSKRNEDVLKAREDVKIYLRHANTVTYKKVIRLQKMVQRGELVQKQCRMLLNEAVASVMLKSHPIFSGAREMLLLENPAMVPPLDFLRQQVDMFVDALRRQE